MRKLAILLAIIAYALPTLVAYAVRPTQEHNSHTTLWVLLVGSALFVAGTLSAIATKVGREAYLDLPVPRPNVRKVEVALLALPLVLAIVLPVGLVLSLFAG